MATVNMMKKKMIQKKHGQVFGGLKTYHQDVQFQEEVISSQQNEICSFEGKKTIEKFCPRTFHRREKLSQSQLLQL